MEIDFVNSAFDLLEGLVGGGLTGLGTDIIGTAVAGLPNSFITLAVVPSLSIIAGALVFVGYSIAKIRTRIKA